MLFKACKSALIPNGAAALPVWLPYTTKPYYGRAAVKSEAYLQLGPLQNKQTDNIHFSYRITVPFLIKVYCTGHLLRLVKMKCGVARIYIYIQPSTDARKQKL